MKKIAALVMSVVVISSLSGCANRYQYRGVNPGVNQGTAQGTRTGYGINNRGTTQGAYRDGIYTGEGNKVTNGNQTATVVISGGRITDITLRTVDAQGIENTGTSTGTGNTANTPGTGFYGTPGSTTGGANGGMAGDITGTPRGNTGYVTGDYSFQNIGGDAGGMIGGTVDGTTEKGNTGNAMGGTAAGSSNYDRIRKQISTSMINQQTSEVALNENDNSVSRNWKLAVRRALDKARTGGTTGGATGNMGGTSR
jgi:hypothetical protein